MREIKFRAWVQTSLTDHTVGTMQFTHYDDGSINWELLTEEAVKFPEDVHLMQYTGLKDKNGKEIYEADIIYLAGYGDYVVEFPFIELYEAVAEGDIGEIKGNIYED